MESPATSYSVYPPGNVNPSRPPLRRSAPEEARSGFPFLVAMAGLVLAVAIGAVARFCPQDLRIDHGGSHAAKPAAVTTTPAVAIDPPTSPSAPVIAPTTFTTVGDTNAAPAATVAVKKKVVRRSGLPRTRGSTSSATSPATSASAAASPSASADIPENPYSPPSNPEAYGF